MGFSMGWLPSDLRNEEKRHEKVRYAVSRINSCLWYNLRMEHCIILCFTNTNEMMS